MSIPTGTYLWLEIPSTVGGVIAPRVTKAEQALRTRRNLLEAAGRLYYERGFAAVSLDDIAAAAGVTKGAVYAHFANKDELVVAVMSMVESTTLDLSMFDAGGTLGEQVRTFARSLADSVDPRAIAVQADYLSIALRNRGAGEEFSRIVHDALTAVGAAVDEANHPRGRFTGIEVAVIIDALLQGLLIRHTLNPELVPDQLVEDALGLVFSALVIGIVDPDEAVSLLDAQPKPVRGATRPSKPVGGSSPGKQ